MMVRWSGEHQVNLNLCLTCFCFDLMSISRSDPNVVKWTQTLICNIKLLIYSLYQSTFCGCIFTENISNLQGVNRGLFFCLSPEI